MKYSLYEIFDFSFKLVCIVTVVAMTSYWFLKFESDEDICLVDYDYFKGNQEIAHPEVSLCIKDPEMFLMEKLEPYTNSSAYLKFLKGDKLAVGELDRIVSNIKFDLVSIDFKDYYLGTEIYWKNSSISTFVETKVYLTFVGFVHHLIKCFGVDMKAVDMKEVKYARHMYNLSLISNHLKDTSNIFASFHYPNQLLHFDNGQMLPSLQRKNVTAVSLGVLLSGMEILKRRNRDKKPCLQNWKRLDESILKQHIERVGCTAPYHGTYKKFPACSTTTQIRSSFYQIAKQKELMNNVRPCQEMSTINVDVVTDYDKMTEDQFVVYVEYPEKAKVISQSREIDIHSLVGNVGGYIGLFLGMPRLYSSNMISYVTLCTTEK